MRSVTIGMAVVEKRYMADYSIVVSVEREGPASNHSLPLKEVRREDVQNPGLHGTISDKRAQELRPRTWSVKDQYILPTYGFPSLSTAPVYIESVFLLEFAYSGERFSGRLRRDGAPTDRISKVPDRLYGVLFQFEHRCCPVILPGKE